MAAQSTTSSLPEALGMYVDELRRKLPAIDEVWSLETQSSRDLHRLLLFADSETLDALRSNDAYKRGDVDLYIVIKGERVERAWGERETLAMADLQWKLIDAQNASYAAHDGASKLTGQAVRVR